MRKMKNVSPIKNVKNLTTEVNITRQDKQKRNSVKFPYS